MMEFCLLLTAADIAASVSGSGMDGRSFLPLLAGLPDDGVGVRGSGTGVLGLTTGSGLTGVSSIGLGVATLAVWNYKIEILIKYNKRSINVVNIY